MRTYKATILSIVALLMLASQSAAGTTKANYDTHQTSKCLSNNNYLTWSYGSTSELQYYNTLDGTEIDLQFRASPRAATTWFHEAYGSTSHHNTPPNYPDQYRNVVVDYSVGRDDHSILDERRIILGCLRVASHAGVAH